MENVKPVKKDLYCLKKDVAKTFLSAHNFHKIVSHA